MKTQLQYACALTLIGSTFVASYETASNENLRGRNGVVEPALSDSNIAKSDAETSDKPRRKRVNGVKETQNLMKLQKMCQEVHAELMAAKSINELAKVDPKTRKLMEKCKQTSIKRQQESGRAKSVRAKKEVVADADSEGSFFYSDDDWGWGSYDWDWGSYDWDWGSYDWDWGSYNWDWGSYNWDWGSYDWDYGSYGFV